MKKKLVIVLAVVLTLTLVLTSVTFGAVGKKEVTLAQEAGQAWLDNMVALTGEPLEWTGASLAAPQVCYDLKEKPNAYIFTMENDGEVVGYIIVGSSAYGYPMFEAADVPPPSIPSADAVKSILGRDLGLKVAKIGTPTRLLYLGFDNLFAVYQAGQQEVAVNLKFNFATQASNLKAAMPSPEVYKARVEATEQSQPEVLAGSTSTVQSTYYQWGLLRMTAYQGCGTGIYKCGCCGPCSGVSIGRYYREHRFDFDGDGDPDDGYAWLPDNDDMYDRLFDYMGTNDKCTTYYLHYGEGFVDMAESTGHHDYFSHVTMDMTDDWPSELFEYYWMVAGAIDNGWPTALNVKVFADAIYPVPGWPPERGHYVAIKGYFPPAPYYWFYYAIACTDSLSGADNLYLDWVHLSDPTIHMRIITIKDRYQYYPGP